MDKLDAEFKFGQEALNLRTYRQQVLSSNIANADTPDYKARDLNFSQALTGALARSGMSTGVNSGTLAMAAPSSGVAASPGGVTLATDAAGQMAGSASPGGGAGDNYGALLYRNPEQQSADNPPVDLDKERVEFADNTLHYESGLTEMTSQIKTMLAALSTGT